MDLSTVTSYRRAARRDDLVLSEGETYLSGGTWLFSEPQPGASGLVDLTSLGWTPWERTEEGLTLAATCTVEELLAVPDVALGSAHELARQCADAFLMSFKIQHLATLGGNVCLALPAGAMISFLVALDATAVIWTADGGERREPVRYLVTGARTTTLAAGEVLRSFEVSASALLDRYAFRRCSLSPLGRSSAVVVARRTSAGVLVTLTAATRRPIVVALGQQGQEGSLARALDEVDCWYADAHGSPDWRAAMARRFAAQCLTEVSS